VSFTVILCAHGHAGFELGIKGMKVGGKRRVIVPPELGPPVGPSTFFSAKQCEVGAEAAKYKVFALAVAISAAFGHSFPCLFGVSRGM
jgi:hypothetical protein